MGRFDSTNKKPKFKTVYSDGAQTFDRKVNEALEKGYIPMGQPFVKNSYIYLSMMLPDEIEKDTECTVK